MKLVVAETDSAAARGVVLPAAAARVYDLLEPPVMFFRHKVLAENTARAVAPREGGRILDVGCGTGLLTAHVAGRIRSGEVVGIDASRPMIEVAVRKRSSSICRFEVAAAERLPFADATFDGVVSAMFFHHVPLEVKRECASEMLRVLKPGGRVAIADLDTPWNWFGRFYGYSGWLLFRQPEIKENLDGLLPHVLRDAGIIDLVSEFQVLGCVRLWTGRKSK
jgi:ubiquinone/menaquinone biosynthesis C-methylase UbiE